MRPTMLGLLVLVVLALDSVVGFTSGNQVEARGCPAGGCPQVSVRASRNRVSARVHRHRKHRQQAAVATVRVRSR